MKQILSWDRHNSIMYIDHWIGPSRRTAKTILCHEFVGIKYLECSNHGITEWNIRLKLGAYCVFFFFGDTMTTTCSYIPYGIKTENTPIAVLWLVIIWLVDWFFWGFNATFSNISAISWRPVLVVEEAEVPRESHQPWASNW